MLKRGLPAMLLCLLASVPAGADELPDAAQAMCEKVKACTLERMERENVSAAERQQAQPALDAMCKSVKDEVAEVVAGHPQYANALECMRSLLELSCVQMQDEKQMATPACVAYEKQMPASDAASNAP